VDVTPGVDRDGARDRYGGVCQKLLTTVIGGPIAGERYNTTMCEEQSKLLLAYRRTIAQYSTAVEALQASIGTVSKEEYHRIETDEATRHLFP
jgi:hypothetical protein